MVARWIARLGVAVLACASSAQAAGFQDVARAVAARDWQTAEEEAAVLDGGRGDFHAAYVAAARLVTEDRCSEALPILEVLVTLRPYFLPGRELAWLCHARRGDRQAATAELDAMLAVLPDGPQRDLIAQLRRNELAKDRPVIDIYGGIIPTTNANRATSATYLPGSGWTIAERAEPGLLLSGGGSVTWRIHDGDGIFVAGVVRADVDYATSEDMVRPALTAELPMTFTAMTGVTLLVAPFASLRFDGVDPAQGRIGARGVVALDLGEVRHATLSAALAHAVYMDAPWRDGLEADAILALGQALDAATRLTTSVVVGYDHTFADIHRTAEFSLVARLDHAADWGLIVGLEAQVGRRLHADPPPAAAQGAPDQTDSFVSGRVELSHRDLVVGPFRPTLHYQYRRQFSDNVFYEFEAHDVGIGLRAKM